MHGPIAILSLLTASGCDDPFDTKLDQRENMTRCDFGKWARLRYSAREASLRTLPGVWPVAFLNAREKLASLSYPSCSAISA